MSVRLSLDDRRWAELVEEGRALIPVYAPEWTDHNLHDPGITLMELFAWVAEGDVYRLNRITEARRAKLLRLVGFVPEPPGGARAAIAFTLAGGTPPTVVPAGVELEGEDAFGERLRFRTMEPVTVVAGKLAAVQVEERGEVTELAGAERPGTAFLPFGRDPRPGGALYLGFTAPLPSGFPVSLQWDVANGGEEERRRLLDHLREAERACRPEVSFDRCRTEPGSEEGTDSAGDPPLVHPSVRLAWEIAVGPGRWRRLDEAAGEVSDGTRALTLAGRVVLTLPVPTAAVRAGKVKAALHYLRCRLVAGAYDAAPEMLGLAFNGVAAEQAVPAGPATWEIAPHAVVSGSVPTAGQEARFEAEFDDQGRISRLTFDRPQAPPFAVLDYVAAAPPKTVGQLTLEAVAAGRGSDKPSQVLELTDFPVAGGEPGFRLWTLEAGSWRAWSERPDFDASRRADAHFVLDRRRGRLRFGDGENGRVIPAGAAVVALYAATRGEAGNLAAGRIRRLAGSLHNRKRVPDFGGLAGALAGIDNPLPARGGSSGETPAEVARRAFEGAAAAGRAVTLADYEELARRTPGTRIARAEARANLHPAFPGFRATGVITLIVLPFLPTARPAPSPALLQAVRAFLTSRRVVGTRLEVVGPTYVEVAVRARVRACRGTSPTALAARLRQALDGFFHPLSGGAAGGGWPLGRDVYRAEVLQVLDQTTGVDHVLSLELVAGGKASCGNVCIPPTGLVVAGPHSIDVE